MREDGLVLGRGGGTFGQRVRFAVSARGEDGDFEEDVRTGVAPAEEGIVFAFEDEGEEDSGVGCGVWLITRS